jgi:hypothetical protein
MKCDWKQFFAKLKQFFARFALSLAVGLTVGEQFAAKEPEANTAPSFCVRYYDFPESHTPHKDSADSPFAGLHSVIASTVTPSGYGYSGNLPPARDLRTPELIRVPVAFD